MLLLGQKKKPTKNNIQTSRLTLQKISKNTGKRSGIDKYAEAGRRKWIFVENDCGILLTIFKLIKRLRCQACNNSWFGTETYLEYFKNEECCDPGEKIN